jgi:tetratricopeptide (TPR) repeat protein
MTVVSEEDPATAGLYSTEDLASVLDVPAARVCTWIASGLVHPAYRRGADCYFNFKEITRAKTLAGLTDTGLSLSSITRSVERLRETLPAEEDPLTRLAEIRTRGRLLVRVAEDELAEVGGQLNFDFYEHAEPIPLHPGTLPREQSEWHERGVRCEMIGELTDAISCYAQALLVGGPVPQICFDLAHAFTCVGEKQRAVERYVQAIELDPTFADAWNNRGVLLAELGKNSEACVAFEGALVNRPGDARARYNLADTLDDLGRSADAIPHWKAYLQLDPHSQWAEHARKRLRAC